MKMRGLLLFIVFLGLLPMILKQPFVGILMWFLWSLMNPQRLVYGFGASINYAMIIAIVTIGSWLLLHPEEPKVPPRDRVTFLLILLMIWITITSLTGFGPPNDIF